MGRGTFQAHQRRRGSFLTPGSSALKAWEAVREQIARRDIRHINVVTNNFMILEDWASSQFARLLGTVVEMAGEAFDALHLALYGDGIKSKLTSGTFRPAVIYIGTSGISLTNTAISCSASTRMNPRGK